MDCPTGATVVLAIFRKEECMGMGKRCWTGVILLAVLNTLPGSVVYGQRLHSRHAAATCPSTTPWAGIYPTVLTPLHCHGGVDTESLERQLHFELQGGVHGLLLLGTIGEGQYVTVEERAQVIVTAVRVAGPHIRVVVGIHTCDPDSARSQLLQARDLGAAAVLVKYIGNPRASAAEVLGFFAALDELHALPIFYYHYPSQTGLKLSPEAVAHILELAGVAGIKESTLNLRETQAHIRLTGGQGKTFLSGTALNLTQFLALGGHGAMCPEAVLLPGPTVQAYEAYLYGRQDEARSLQAELFTMTPILQSRPTPTVMTRAMLTCAEDHKMPVPMGKDQPQARLKYALTCLGVATPVEVKCPLPPLTPKEEKRVQATVSKLKEIDWCEAALKVPPVPLHACPGSDDGGMLLKTGAFQLGPAVGHDWLRSQGDGASFR
jgi:4-hydroxy-tetrahydrodipicolinate synthase